MLFKSSRSSKTLRQSLARLSDYVRAEQRTATRHARKTRQGNSQIQTCNLGDTPTWSSSLRSMRRGAAPNPRRSRKISVIALARRMVGVLWAMWRDGAPYNPAVSRRPDDACRVRGRALVWRAGARNGGGFAPLRISGTSTLRGT